MNHYIILSDGCYSDYTPTYYHANTDNPITHEELKEMDRASTIEAYKKCEELKRVPHAHHAYCNVYHECTQTMDTVNPKNGEVVKREPPSFAIDFFWDILKQKVQERGYSPIPENIPEVNISYDDLNFQKDGTPIDQWWHPN